MHVLVAAAVLNAAFFSDLGKQALDSGAAPGIAVAVVYQGRTVYEGGFGLADRLEYLSATQCVVHRGKRLRQC